MNTRCAGFVVGFSFFVPVTLACFLAMTVPSLAEESSGSANAPVAAPAAAPVAAPAPSSPPPSYPPPATYPGPPGPGGVPPMPYPPYPGYPPYAYPGYPPPPYPAYPPRSTPEAAEEAPAAPVIAPFRPRRLRAGFGMGGFSPSDVNAYLKTKMPRNAYTAQGTTEMVLLMSVDVSFAHYIGRYFGIRPNASYLFSPKIIQMQGDSSSSQGFWLHSLAPGLSLDLAYDEGKVARFFLSPGIAYHLAWFEGYSASGLAFSVAAGVDLSFGQARKKGVSLAFVVRSANLDVRSRPSSPGPVIIDSLDFTSVLFCIGFQTGL